ncbi:MAG: AI-2E family transporter [Nanoarchaeota archaeon]
MKRGSNNDLKRYFLVGIIIVLFFLSYKIIAPYLITLISAFVLAYLSKPLYFKLRKKLGKNLAATICIAVIILIIFLVAGLLAGEISSQVNYFLNNENASSFLERISETSFAEKLNLDVAGLTEKGAIFIVSLVTSAISYLPSIFITLLILVLGVYYILINWETIVTRLKGLLPFKDKEKITKEISQTTKAILYGSLFIALIEFFIAIVGFYILGIKAYILLAVLLFFFAFIPGLGPALIWVPTAIYLLITKSWFSLIGIIIIGVILSYGIDTLLRIKILGKKTKINPFIMLIGIIGGITVFGIFGFIIGPLILVYTIRLVKGIIENR